MTTSRISYPRLVWITAPAAGGRSVLGTPLVEAFRATGCEAVDMSLAKLRDALPTRPADAQEAWREAVRVFWTTFLARPPDLLVDLSPLPAGLVPRMRELGTRTAYWLLENALDPAYAYWKEAAPDYDVVFSHQGEPFHDPRVRYLAWGAETKPTTIPVEVHPEIVLHGSHSINRENFLSAFLAALHEISSGPTIPMKIVGPGWLGCSSALRARAAGRITIDESWLGADASAELVRNRIVLIPLSHPVNFIPPRTWECLAAGACVVAEDLPLLHSDLKPGVDLETYSSPSEAARIVHALLSDSRRRTELARNGATTVAAAHTLTHRVRAILANFDFSTS